MKKRALSMFLVLVLLCTLLPQVTLHVSAEVHTGTCGAEGDNLIWTFHTATGVLTISGDGEMGNTVPWKEYRSSIREVMIESGVTSICDFAFAHCPALYFVTIPSSVTSLGSFAFFECESLSLSLPASVTDTGNYALTGTKNAENTRAEVIYLLWWMFGSPEPTKPEYSPFVDVEESSQYYSAVIWAVQNGITNGVSPVHFAPDRACTKSQVITFFWRTLDQPKPENTENTLEDVPEDTWFFEPVMWAMHREWIDLGIESNCFNPDSTNFSLRASSAGKWSFEFAFTTREHTWGEWVVTIAPTCTEKGEETRTCTVCGLTETREVAALSHNFVNGACTVCGTADPDYEPEKVTFDDVDPDAYYAEAIDWAVGHDPVITTGTGNGKFSPNNNCTRGQVVTFLWRAKGCPEPTGSGENSATGSDMEPDFESPFSDVKEKDFFYKAVLWAVENEITTGIGGGKFGPGKGCTRGQVVTFLWRTENKPEPTSSENPFSDVKANDYFYAAVLWAVEKNITQGTGGGKFSPNKTCTRGQIVTFLYRDLAS